MLVGEPLGGVAVRVLEVQVVFLSIGLVEFAGGDIQGDLDVAGVASLLNGLGDQVQSLLGGLDIRSDTTLVTDVAGGLAVLLLSEGLELVVNLSTLTKTLGEGGSGAVTSVF